MIISYKFIRNDILVTDTDICKAVKTIQIPLLKVTSSEHLSSIITLPHPMIVSIHHFLTIKLKKKLQAY